MSSGSTRKYSSDEMLKQAESGQRSKVSFERAPTRTDQGSTMVDFVCSACGNTTSVPESVWYDMEFGRNERSAMRTELGVKPTGHRVRIRSWVRIFILTLIAPAFLILFAMGEASTAGGSDFISAFFLALDETMGLAVALAAFAGLYSVCALGVTCLLASKTEVWQLPCSTCGELIFVATDNTFRFNTFFLRAKQE